MNYSMNEDESTKETSSLQEPFDTRAKSKIKNIGFKVSTTMFLLFMSTFPRP